MRETHLPKEQQHMATTANPTDFYTHESTCTNCGGEIYRTLLETNGPTRTFWRHDATGYNGCPRVDDEISTWRTNADGSLVCPHRDLSVCETCAAHPQIVDVMGAHYHDPTGELVDLIDA